MSDKEAKPTRKPYPCLYDDESLPGGTLKQVPDTRYMCRNCGAQADEEADLCDPEES